MKKIIRILIFTLAISMGCLAFAGCGDETAATLEDIASSNADLTKTIKENLTTPEGTTSDISFSGDSFDITYTYDDAVDDDARKTLIAAFDENSGQLQESCEAAISDMQKQTEISGITCTVCIKNADGDELWSCTYPEQE